MTPDLRLDPREAALIVVDMQNGFCHPEGALGRARGAETVARPRAIIPDIVRLIDVSRSLGASIVFTRQVYYPDDRGRARHRIPFHLDRSGTPIALCQDGTWDSELVDEIAAAMRPGDEVIVKHRSSAFFHTTLEQDLRLRGKQVLVVTGTTTSYCVDATIRDAYARDFDVIVPPECVADRDDAAQEAVLNAVRRYHGAVMTIEELSAAFGGGSPSGVGAAGRSAR